MRGMAAAIGLLVAVSAGAQTSRPRITPFFSTVAGGPAFFLECENDTGLTLSTAEARWVSALRLDGKALPEEPSTMGGGLSMEAEPGSVWMGMIQLRPTRIDYYPAPRFRAMVRLTRHPALSEGSHTLAFRCGDVWSEETRFYWEAETLAPSEAPRPSMPPPHGECKFDAPAFWGVGIAGLVTAAKAQEEIRAFSSASGVVIFDARIDEKGKVTSACVLRSVAADLDAAALAALEKCTFRPARFKDPPSTPVPIVQTVAVKVFGATRTVERTAASPHRRSTTGTSAVAQQATSSRGWFARHPVWTGVIIGAAAGTAIAAAASGREATPIGFWGGAALGAGVGWVVSVGR